MTRSVSPGNQLNHNALSASSVILNRSRLQLWGEKQPTVRHHSCITGKAYIVQVHMWDEAESRTSEFIIAHNPEKLLFPNFELKLLSIEE